MKVHLPRSAAPKYSFSTEYGKVIILRDANGFIFMGNLIASIALIKSNCLEEDKFLMIEELRQEFFNTYPELQKTPQANINFENNHKYLNEICDKYTSINEISIPTETEEITNNMKNNVLNLEGDQSIEKVRKNFILEI